MRWILSLLLAAVACRAGDLRVLIATGANDHDWRSTAPCLKKILRDTGRFDASIDEKPAGLTDAALGRYDVLVVHYNGVRWGATAERAVENFVKSGKGIVALHSASYAFGGLEVRGDSVYGVPPGAAGKDGRRANPRFTGIVEAAWPEYAKIIGASWEDAKLRKAHAPRHVFPVRFTDREHPIARGLPETFSANDELYHNMNLSPDAKVIATAYDDPAAGGTGRNEPMIWTVGYGKGRALFNALGHDTKAMSEPGFIAAFTRGVEWAATGAVAPAASVDVDAASARPLRRAIFSTATTYNFSGLVPEDPVLVRIMRTVRPPVLRMPAGNTMNLWDWNTGTVRTADQLRKFGADPNFRLSAGPVKERDQYVKDMRGPMVAERWARLAKEGGSEPLWGLNVSTMSAEENRKFLLHLKAAGLPATLFELGNELYLSQLWGHEVDSVQTYIRKAKAVAREVKSVFPQAKVAVCVQVSFAKAMLEPGGGSAQNAWNAALARESFYDAVVVHSYTFSQELGTLKDKTAGDYARWAIVRSSDACVKAGLAVPGRVFPGKEIWLTEWNLNNRIYKRDHADVGNRFLPEHTLLSGLFTASFVLNAASVPSNLSIANYWQMYGGPDFGLISGEPPKERPAFHVFRMLSTAVHECDAIAALAVPEAPRVRGPAQFAVAEAPTVTGFAFFRGGQLKHLAFVNFSERDVTCAVRPKQETAGRGKAEVLTGPELLPAWNNPGNPSPSAWDPKYEVRQADVRLDALPLPARSFTVIAIGR